MSKDRMRTAAVKQVDNLEHEVPEKHRELVGGKREARTVRLVVRLNSDEFRRLSRYAEDKHLAVSTAVRSLAMDGIRRA